MQTGQEKCSLCGEVATRYTILIGPPRQIVCGTCQAHPPASITSTFPFVTRNFDGSPITVNSMRHLRKLEREHGVQSVTYNQNSRNFDDAPQQAPPNYDWRR